MRKRRKDEKEHGNLERWLLTYADMITLLMAFFIMMYSMSVLNLSRFREAAFSIRSGFGGNTQGQGKTIFGTSGTVAEHRKPIQGDTAGVPWKDLQPLVRYIENIDDSKASIGEDSRGIVVTLQSDDLVFRPGRADVRPNAKPVLDKTAATIAKTGNLVRIEGHTCDLPVRGEEYATNWELSTARATNVLEYMVDECGLNPWRFSAAGYGSVRPLEINDSESHRTKNRRVEIVILRPDDSDEKRSENGPRRISDPSKAVIQRRLEN